MEVVDKSKTALAAAIDTVLSELDNAESKPLTISASKAICSFISNEKIEAAPTISKQVDAISAHLYRLLVAMNESINNK